MRQRTYTLHVPADAQRGDPRALERSEVVPDGFTWGAFVFSVLWFLRYRLWLAALLVAVALVGLSVTGRLIGLPVAATFAISLLAGILIGLEASSLRRWTYGRNGLPARDAVLAGSLEEAESKAAARWLDAGAAPVEAQPAAISETRAVRRESSQALPMFSWNEGTR